MGSAEGVRAWVLMDGQIADNVHTRALEAYCAQEYHARKCQAYLDTRYAMAPEAPEHSLGKSGGGAKGFEYAFTQLSQRSSRSYYNKLIFVLAHIWGLPAQRVLNHVPRTPRMQIGAHARAF